MNKYNKKTVRKTYVTKQDRSSNVLQGYILCFYLFHKCQERLSACIKSQNRPAVYKRPPYCTYDHLKSYPADLFMDDEQIEKGKQRFEIKLACWPNHMRRRWCELNFVDQNKDHDIGELLYANLLHKQVLFLSSMCQCTWCMSVGFNALNLSVSVSKAVSRFKGEKNKK